jgi:hypothetical protein
MSSMPVAEPMTAEEYLARPYDPREAGYERAGLELTRDDALTSPLLPGLELPVGAIFAA